MKNKLLIFGILLIIPVVGFAYYGQTFSGCFVDRITGNKYCRKSLASRYKSIPVDYSTTANWRNTSDYYRENQICARNSHFEPYPLNACVCDEDYVSGRDRISCVKRPEVLSDEATKVLLKALSGQALTIKEKGSQSAIQTWLKDAFSR